MDMMEFDTILGFELFKILAVKSKKRQEKTPQIGTNITSCPYIGLCRTLLRTGSTFNVLINSSAISLQTNPTD